MKKTCKIVYVVVCLLIMLLPFVGMIFFQTDETTENKTLAEMPKLQTEEGLNKEYRRSSVHILKIILHFVHIW